MSAGRYATITFPRRATFDAVARQPASFLTELMAAALNHGMPALRPGGPVIAWVGRRRPPTKLATSALRAMPRRPAPGVDAVLQQVREAWAELAASAPHLPPTVPHLSALQVTRSAAETLFVFGQARFPLLVLKYPHAGDEGVQKEFEALVRAQAASGVAPRPLGVVGRFHVQEGLPGLPLPVTPVWLDDAATLRRTTAFEGLDRALEHLARHTAHSRNGAAPMLGWLDRADSYPLPPRVVTALRSARERLARLDVAVLQHRDMSAQNWIVDGDRFVGLVDWELASPIGTPGLDAMQAGVSLFEHGMGLARWSERDVVAGFRAAWRLSPFFEDTRKAVRSTTAAVGVSADVADSLEIAFFARRLGRAMRRSDSETLGPRGYAEMLTAVCLS